ncbi:Uncharacterised protein [Mycobacteroides abscessus subsp. abscessus]|nr:Uncharacterised protein [Mycobacteroides abscessus subsp. abscessus]
MPCETGVGPYVTRPLSISHASLVDNRMQALAWAEHGATGGGGWMIAGTPGMSGPPGHRGSAWAMPVPKPAADARPRTTARRPAQCRLRNLLITHLPSLPGGLRCTAGCREHLEVSDDHDDSRIPRSRAR